jgi:hypothetical protein
MGWALATIATVMIGVAFLLWTVRRIHRAVDEQAHYRLSVDFWAGLAVLGVATLFLLARPLVAYEWVRTEAGIVSVGLIAVLPVFVIVAGLRNAISLSIAMRRRRRALSTGRPLQGRVVERARWLLGQDLMAVVLEADVPRPNEGRELAYRARDPEHCQRRRFVETCPADHWSRFEPGTHVIVLVDLDDPDTFALRLFEPAA